MSLLALDKKGGSKNKAAALMLAIIFGICLISILGSLVYYFSSVTTIWLIIIGLAAAAGSMIFYLALPLHLEDNDLNRPTKTYWLAIAGIFVSIAAWWSVILKVEIFESVRTPWEIINPIVVIALGLSIFLLALTIQKRVSRLTTIITALIFFSAISMAAVVYPLGYGFDPFIHQATVAHIAEFGTITPKPYYYIGEYAIELFAHLFLPIKFIDVWLVPLLSSILIAGSAAIGLSKLKIDSRLGLIAIFLLPLGAFITTTPQSLAYVLTACLIFLSIPRLIDDKSIPLWFLALLALTTIFIHPLAGIPAAIFVVLVLVRKYIWLSIPVAVLGSCSLPVVFVYQAANSDLAIKFSLTSLALDQLNLSFFFANHFNIWFDGMYLVIDNLLWILIILAAAGYFFIRKSNLNYLLVAALMWFINYLILTLTLQFEFLIEYERTNYADRLLTLTMIFLIPHSAIAIAGIMNKIKKSQALSVTFIAILSLMITANIYGAYPRHDNYARSAGFNVSEDDISAAYAIDDAAGDQDFIVLANQAVSSAALQEFGFKKYYHNDIFYYPIPTGGQLYYYYLQMTDEEPTRETMEEAMNLAGVNLGFFVVNEYWWQSEIIIEHAKNEADDWFSVGDGAVTVFEFRGCDSCKHDPVDLN